MSKFLKFIVNIFLICAILIAAAILIPPLAGVQTTIVDTASMDTNLPLGSITYSTDVDVSKIKTGDEVLKDNSTSTYAYIVKEINRDNDTFTVVNAMDQNARTEEITLRNSVPKVAVVVPYIGYVIIAMHSTEGIVIIALVVALIVILFILSELWKEKPEDEEEENEEKSQKTYSFVEGEEEKRGVNAETEEKAPLTDSDMAVPDAEGTEISDSADEEQETSAEATAPENEEEKLPEVSIEEEAASEQTGNEEKAPEITLEVKAEEQHNPGDDLEKALAGIYSESDKAKNANASAPKTDRLLDGADQSEETDARRDVTIDEPKPQEEPEQQEEEQIKPGDTQEFHLETEPKEETADSDAYDLSDVIERATKEAEKEAEKEAGNERKEEPAGDTAPETAEAAAGQEQKPADEEPEPEDEEPEQFVPVEHATLDELLDQAKKNGDEPDVSKDDATGITIVDYSGTL